MVWGTWYFHSLEHDIYAARDCFPSFNAANSLRLDNAKYYTVQHGALVPDPSWTPFWSRDNKRLCQREEGSEESIPVGRSQMLYEVTPYNVLKSIYYDSTIQAKVAASNWVFEGSSTPCPGSWSAALSTFAEKVKPWSMAYRVKLGKALKDNDVFESVVLDLTVLATDLKSLKAVMSPCLDESDISVHLFTGNILTRKSLVLRSMLVRDGVPCSSAKLEPFSWDTYKKKADIKSPFLPESPGKVKSVCFVVHGVGQEVAEENIKANVIWDIATLWAGVNSYLDEIKHLNDDHGNPDQVLVLPVNWRSLITIDSPYKVENTLPLRLQSFRKKLCDILMDIPLYLSSKKQTILDVTVEEANRLYQEVVSRQPSFAEEGRVHIIAHSLGSVISAEILAKQPDDASTSNALFKFNTDNLFCIGSPLALLWYDEGKQLTSRAEFARRKDQGLDHNNLRALAVRNLYNFSHEVDFVSTRFSPMVFGIDPQNAPVPGDLGAGTSYCLPVQAACGRARAFIGTIKQETTDMLTKLKPVDYNVIDQGLQTPLMELNENGQVDWSIKCLNPLNPLWEIYSSHLSYWREDVLLRFLAVEIDRDRGVTSTLPNYRAVFSDLGGPGAKTIDSNQPKAVKKRSKGLQRLAIWLKSQGK